MSLAPGTSVGRYRSVGTLGAGGMGVGYDAEDTRLGRRVALRFLPEGLARDPLALERFEREAREALHARGRAGVRSFGQGIGVGAV